MYCGHVGAESPENWNFCMAFAFFRLAATLQGLYKRSLAGEEPSRAGPVLHRSPARAQTHEHRCGESSRAERGEVRAAACRLCTLRAPKFRAVKQSVAFLAVLCFQHEFLQETKVQNERSCFTSVFGDE